MLGIFKLTDSGLERVRRCNLPGFHPTHEGDYCEASHVRMTPNLRYKVIDQR